MPNTLSAAHKFRPDLPDRPKTDYALTTKIGYKMGALQEPICGPGTNTPKSAARQVHIEPDEKSAKLRARWTFHRLPSHEIRRLLKALISNREQD